MMDDYHFNQITKMKKKKKKKNPILKINYF